MPGTILRAVFLAFAASATAHAECEPAPRGSDGVVELVRPIASDYKLVGGFGYRRHPLLGSVRPHVGIDYAAPVGTTVVTAARGEIVEATRKGEFGTYILIRHGDGAETEYAHLSSIASGIEPGVCVFAGAVIGYVGTTGLSIEPHLHMGLRLAGRLVDPLPHIKDPAPDRR